MRVALTTTFSPWDPRAGAAQFGTRELADALHAKGVEVSVVYTMEGHADGRAEAATDYPVRWASMLRTTRRRGSAGMSEHAAPTAWALQELDREGPLQIVHGQGEEMALAADAVPHAKRVLSAHASERRPVRPGKPDDASQVCLASLRTSLEAADAIVVSGARDMRASMLAPLVAWERIVAIERGVPWRFLGGEGWLGTGSPMHLLVAGGSGDDANSRRFVEGLRSLSPDRYLPVHWLGGFGERRARAGTPRNLQLPPGVSLFGMPDERSLHRMVGRASEVVVLDGGEAASTLLRIAIAMGKRIVTSEEGLRAVVTSLESLPLRRLPCDAEGFRDLVLAASRHRDTRADESDELRAFARQHLSWSSVADRHIELYERLLRSGDESASPTPESA